MWLSLDEITDKIMAGQQVVVDNGEHQIVFSRFSDNNMCVEEDNVLDTLPLEKAKRKLELALLHGYKILPKSITPKPKRKEE